MHSNTIWMEIKISVPASEADAIANFLIEQGANGVVEESQASSPDPSSVGNNVMLKAYIKKDASVQTHLNEIKKYLTSLSSLTGNNSYELLTDEIEDEDWNALWKSFFQPIKVTKRIVVKPSWKTYWKQEQEIVIELDPGMAFGTGTHASTRLCLQAVEELADKLSDKSHCSLLDVGTGSGILAIAAVLLGIPKVVGIDIDYQAVECAKKNAETNNVSDKLIFTNVPLYKTNGAFSMIVANILPQTLIDLKADLLSHLAPSGYLILSGILKEKAREVIDEFIKDISFVGETQEDEWSCLIFKLICT
jgi:ribosomal protein L11 methyltransferase